MKRRKVLVAMSGGVDSSVAAFLLAEAGYDVTGVTMCLGIAEDGARTRCCGKEAIDDARAVCRHLGIAHHVMDFADDLRDAVIDKFIREYRRGRTPNPCIDCNRHLKFGRLLGTARAAGFDYLATGHYAAIKENGSELKLAKAKDTLKDQTYFLYPIGKDDLADILFPLGKYTKDEVRAIAEKARLPVAAKAESQDICFVGDGGYGRFISEIAGRDEPGPVVDMSGREVGRHRGIIFYTVGQRRGLGIAAREPLHVVSIDAENNLIVVGGRENVTASALNAGDFNVLVDEMPETGEAKIRHRKAASPCAISPEENCVRIEFFEPQEAITPGQAVVLYRGDEVLGGGVIDEVIHGAC